jgi:hypothetical protein
MLTVTENDQCCSSKVTTVALVRANEAKLVNFRLTPADQFSLAVDTLIIRCSPT